MKMKNYILLLAWMLSLNVMTASAQSKSSQIVNNVVQTARQKAEEALQAAEEAQKLADRLVAAADSIEEGIEAFSDTSEVASGNVFSDMDDEDSNQAEYDNFDWDPSHYDNPLSWLVALTATTGGILVAILVVILVLLIIFLPFIILALILRLIVKRHNDRINLAEKAMENGQPIPESLQGIDKQSDEYLWKRGIRNAAIGLGLMLMFWIWHANTLVGIGVLVLCLGVGQMIMSKTSNKDKF
ncbi:MAG: hypothetical protein IKX24_01105 [Prevotella sp.]|nr:hypothetical protein [Prevotella sp.]MBR5060722.1 hypothetical protein [Prevotella sp.]